MKFQRISATVQQVTIDTQDIQPFKGLSILDTECVGGNEEQQAQLGLLLEKYSHIFAIEDDDLGYTDKVHHEIHLTDHTPITEHNTGKSKSILYLPAVEEGVYSEELQCLCVTCSACLQIRW